jgi:hypothetical protein
MGRFAIDYIVVERDDDGWDDYAIEVNLRKGGTTHPFLTLQFLTDGTYDEERAVFVAPDGKEKHYVAADHLRVDGLEAITFPDLLEAALIEHAHFDQTTLTGTVFHMLSAMPTHGYVGVTCVDDSRQLAERRYADITSFLTRLVERSTAAGS